MYSKTSDKRHLLGCLNYVSKLYLTYKCTCNEWTPSCHVGTLFECPLITGFTV